MKARLRPARAGQGRQPAGPGGHAASSRCPSGRSRRTAPAGARSRCGSRPAGTSSVESGELPRRDDRPPTAGPCSRPVPLAAPLDFFAFVVRAAARGLRRPAAHRAGRGTRTWSSLLQAWKDDPAWADRIGAAVRGCAARPAPRTSACRGRPTEPLVDPRGRQPGRRTRTRACSTRPRTGMEVAYWADRGVVIHQAAHGWFNGDAAGGPLGERGLRLALRAARRREARRARRQPADDGRGPGGGVPAQRVGRGRRPGDDDGRRHVRVRGIARRSRRRSPSGSGTDVLAAVWSDAAAGTGAYQPPAPARMPAAAGAAGAGAATPGGRRRRPGLARRCSTCSRPGPART